LKKRFIVAIITSLIFFYICSLVVDYKLAVQEIPPKFAFKKSVLKDGGSTVYLGFGYIITDYNQMDGRNDIQFTSPFFFKSIKDKTYKENN
jgi:hypothetical protein